MYGRDTRQKRKGAHKFCINQNLRSSVGKQNTTFVDGLLKYFIKGRRRAHCQGEEFWRRFTCVSQHADYCEIANQEGVKEAYNNKRVRDRRS